MKTSTATPALRTMLTHTERARLTDLAAHLTAGNFDKLGTALWETIPSAKHADSVSLFPCRLQTAQLCLATDGRVVLTCGDHWFLVAA